MNVPRQTHVQGMPRAQTLLVATRARAIVGTLVAALPVQVACCFSNSLL